ncbi:MAG: adenylate/guanylate cyclase [Streptosporangiaceae bacterium]|jgi:adenylate cyclase|nr:adenylate/guanylate cyclase [Streptosporangiaceae bacterium]
MSARSPDPKRVEELLLGGDKRYTRVDVQRMTGVTREFTQRLWRAFGYPHMPDDTVAFTEGDVTALYRIQRLMQDDVLDDDDVIRMVRAVGQTMTKLAEWQVNLLTSKIAGDLSEPPTVESVQFIIDLAERHIPDFEPLIVHAWRRQLAAAGTRAMAMAASEEDAIPARIPATIGFADMVSFTQMSRELDEMDLARVVERFEETASDVIAASGGRLVKSLGDEVLFSADSPELGAEIALSIAETIKDETEVPDVRVGVAHGPVLPLMGDVFGTTVNLAARLTSIARPGAVVIDAELAAELDGSESYEVTRIVRRPARGLGIIQPYVLRRRTRGGSRRV